MAKRRPQREVKSNQPFFAACIAVVVVTALVAGFRLGRFAPDLEDLERRSLDARFRLRGPRPSGGEIVIVAFDDKTHQEDATMFENRAAWAKLIVALKTGNAKAIGIDAFFANPERILPADLTSEVGNYVAAHTPPQTEADRLLTRVEAETTGDQKLVAAIAAAGNVVLGVHMGLRGSGEGWDQSLSRSKYGQSVPGPWQPRPVKEVIASLPMFNRAAKGLGSLTVHEDDTQTVRVLPLVRALGDSMTAPLAVQVLAQWLGVGRSGIAYVGTDHTVRIGDRTIELVDDDGILLNFRGPAGSFPTYSAVDVVKGRVPAGVLDGKLVLIGYTYLGHDHTRTSFGPGQPGVEMHATAIDNLLRGDALRRAPWHFDVLATLGIAFAVAILFFGGFGLAAYSQALGALLIVGGYFIGTYLAFANRGYWLCWVGPLMASISVTLVAITVAYAREGVQRRRLRHAFGHYLAEGVINELLQNPSALALGGERRNLSVLFSDIRGFTSFSEKLAPDQLVKVLNTYLTPMTRAVLESGGFLDKFIGDAVMAVFGAPVPDERHPVQALACALRMHAELARIRPELDELGVEIAIGIGINSGDMAVGNMGSAEHFNYTVMGDAVNLASRLEGLTKSYGVFCIVGEETRRVSEGFVFREIDLVRVKGKEKPVAIFELLGDATTTIASYRGLDRFAAGVAAYRAGDFPGARAAFAAFSVDNPNETVAALYLDRLRTLGDSAPPTWDGITIHTAK